MTLCTTQFNCVIYIRPVQDPRTPSCIPEEIPDSSVIFCTSQFTDLLIGWFARGSVNKGSDQRSVQGK